MFEDICIGCGKPLQDGYAPQLPSTVVFNAKQFCLVELIAVMTAKPATFHLPQCLPLVVHVLLQT